MCIHRTTISRNGAAPLTEHQIPATHLFQETHTIPTSTGQKHCFGKTKNSSEHHTPSSALQASSPGMVQALHHLAKGAFTQVPHDLI